MAKKDFSKSIVIQPKGYAKKTVREKALGRLENSKNLWKDPTFTIASRKRGGESRQTAPQPLYIQNADGTYGVMVMVGRIRIALNKDGGTAVQCVKDDVLDAHDWLAGKVKNGDYDKELADATVEASKYLQKARGSKRAKA
jgi:hypothetical protein